MDVVEIQSAWGLQMLMSCRCFLCEAIRFQMAIFTQGMRFSCFAPVHAMMCYNMPQQYVTMLIIHKATNVMCIYIYYI